MTAPRGAPNFIGVRCTCGRPMGFTKRVPGVNYYCAPCDAGVTVDLESLEVGHPDRCGARTDDARCNRELPEGASVCSVCADSIVREAVGKLPLRLELAEQIVELEQQRAEERHKAREQRKARERAEQRADPTHVVYYIATGPNQVKIGTTGNLPRRLREFRVANHDNLLAVEPGGYDLERQRHATYEKWRWKKGHEDFAQAPELMAHIAAVRVEHGDPREYLVPRTTEEQR